MAAVEHQLLAVEEEVVVGLNFLVPAEAVGVLEDQCLPEAEGVEEAGPSLWAAVGAEAVQEVRH